jgi:hypothetical protein
MAGLPRPAQINTCSRPEFSRSQNLSSLVWSPSSDGAERDGWRHRENAGIAENIAPPAANRPQHGPQAEPIPAFLPENSSADLEEPSARWSMFAENQIGIPERKRRDGVISPLFPLANCELQWRVVLACVW